jgi:hypothetical protein
MVLQSKLQPEDDDEKELQPQEQPQRQPEPRPQSQPRPQPKPTSAPAVPKELLSARPAMTRIVPRAPEKMAQMQAAQEAAQKKPVPPPQTPQQVAERKERMDYLRNLTGAEKRPVKKKRSKKWMLVPLVLLLLAGAGAGAYAFLQKRGTTAQPTAATNQAQTAQPTTTATPSQSTTAEMKDLQSTNLPVSLKYPADWAVSDTAPKLTITSTKQTFTNVAGKKVSGQVVVMIRPKQTTLAEFKTGNAAAVLDSKKVNYAQPAAGQRGSTYLSYLQYAATTTKGALDAIYVTGNAGYTKAQVVPQADVVKVDPLINVYFVECPNDTCTTAATPTSIEAAAWSASTLNTTVEDILKSLAIS